MPNMFIDKNSGVIRVPLVNETGKSYKVKKGQTIALIERSLAVENQGIKEVVCSHSEIKG